MYTHSPRNVRKALMQIQCTKHRNCCTNVGDKGGCTQTHLHVVNQIMIFESDERRQLSLFHICKMLYTKVIVGLYSNTINQAFTVKLTFESKTRRAAKILGFDSSALC